MSELPPFVAHVGQEPASFLQASFLVDGRVLTFRQPLLSLDAEAVAAAAVKLAEEVAKCRR